MKTVTHGILLALATTASVGCSTLNNPAKAAASAERQPLRVERYVGSEAGFDVTSNLIVGSTEAVLVDAQFTRSDAKKVVEMIRATGKTLKTVFITHEHPDHYFGVETLKNAFPDTRFVATRETVQDIQKTGPGKLAYWKTLYGAELPDSLPQISELTTDDISLDGEPFELRSLLPGESEHANVLVVPSLKAAFVGDLAYDDVHVWLADAVHSVDSWKKNLDAISADSDIQSVYVGHQKTSRNNSKDVLKATRTYINDAMRIFAASKSPEEASKALQTEYPGHALPVIADLAAKAFVTNK